MELYYPLVEAGGRMVEGGGRRVEAGGWRQLLHRAQWHACSGVCSGSAAACSGNAAE